MADEVEVRRSARRTRTVSAWRQDGRIVVAIPARFSQVEEDRWVQTMTVKLAATQARRHPSDADLSQRAETLSRRYLGGRAVPASVNWSARQGRRWGSCTVADRTIRVSDRLQGMPGWVLDYVLIHELVHLLHPHHGPQFWAQVAAYPQADRARGFLDGVAHVRGQDGPTPEPDEV